MPVGWVAPPGLFPRRFDLVTGLDGTGAGTNIITNTNSAAVWVVVALSVITVPTSAATCKLSPPTGILDTAYFAGTGDIAEGPHFLYHGDSITLTWASGPANGQGICTYEYYEVPA